MGARTREARVAASGERLARRSAWSHPRSVVGSAKPAAQLVGLQLAQRATELAAVAAEGRQERVRDHAGGAVLGARDRADEGGRGQRRPQHGRGLRQPQVDVAVLAERAQELDLGHRQARVPEQREPAGQVEPCVAGREARERRRVAYVRRGRLHAVDEAAPQLGLPAQVGGERLAVAVRVVAGAPVADELRTLDGVRAEESREPSRHGVAPRGALVGRVAVPEVAAEVGEAGLVEAAVDDLQQRPRQPVGAPRVLGVAVEQHRDERVGRHEVDARAHAVAAARAHAEAVRQPLGQPALDPAGGHDHHLAGERVGERGDQQVRQAVGERVGALGGVQVQGHAATL